MAHESNCKLESAQQGYVLVVFLTTDKSKVICLPDDEVGDSDVVVIGKYTCIKLPAIS